MESYGINKGVNFFVLHVLSSGPDTGEVGTYALGVGAVASEKCTLQWLALLGFLNFILALFFQTFCDHIISC